MFDDTQSLQEFILWCREAKIKALQVGDIKVEFSDLAFLDYTVEEPGVQKAMERAAMDESAQADAEAAAENEDLLFWSSKS